MWHLLQQAHHNKVLVDIADCQGKRLSAACDDAGVCSACHLPRLRQATESPQKNGICESSLANGPIGDASLAPEEVVPAWEEAGGPTLRLLPQDTGAQVHRPAREPQQPVNTSLLLLTGSQFLCLPWHTAQNLQGSLSCQKVTQVELGSSCWRIIPE